MTAAVDFRRQADRDFDDRARRIADAYKAQTAGGKIPIVHVQIERAEGRTSECYKREFSGPLALSHANNLLATWARTAPGYASGYDAGSGYHKCDFWIAWADGETYKGRFDLERRHIGGGNLIGRHVRDFLEFLALRRTPAHLIERYGDDAEARQRAYIEDVHDGAETIAQAGAFLDTRDLGGA